MGPLGINGDCRRSRGVNGQICEPNIAVVANLFHRKTKAASWLLTPAARFSRMER